ncbi:MAG: TlpA family protein disulfide reductase [Planctomycetia bacterium]|nr:TlpA family protein disulfide reductase [Planctomycetia bacterium]
MSHRPAGLRSSLLPFVSTVLAVVAGVAIPVASLHARQPAATTAAPEAGTELSVPPLPQGTPEQMLEFVEGLLPPKTQPRSRKEMMKYISDVSRVSVEAADAILPKVKADDPIYAKAAKLKLESLMRLSQLGDKQAGEDMASFAATLANSPVKELATEAKRLAVVSAAQKMFAEEKFDTAPALVKQVAALLAADPDDQKTAGLVMQFCGALEQIPDGEKVAADALMTFGPILAGSKDPKIKELGESFAGKLRLLSLPGKPMEIKGELLDGKPFNQKGLAGKVVLVDFWATWCGPCIAEIPNMLEQYEKYHDKGFEVVGISLDEEKDKVDAFVAENKIPWPIIYAGKGWQDPTAQFYGISGIPQLILIGRDGNVITLNARGEKLAERLAELFKDAG